MVQGKIWTVVLCVIARAFRYVATEGSEKRTTYNSVYQTKLTCTEMCTRQVHSFLYVSVLLEYIRKSVYRFKLCPSNWPVQWGTFTH